MHGLSDREQAIAAAGYLKGLAVGMAIDRSERWIGRIMGSPLATTAVYPTVDDLLRDGRSYNPLLIYETIDLARACGIEKNHHEASRAVRVQLRPPPKMKAKRCT